MSQTESLSSTLLEIVQSISFSDLLSALPPSEILALSVLAQNIGSSLALALKATAGVIIVLGVVGSVRGVLVISGMKEERGWKRRREKLEKERIGLEREGLRLRRYEVLMESLGVKRVGLVVWLAGYLEGVMREMGGRGRMLVFYDCGIIASQLRGSVLELGLCIEVFTNFDTLLLRAADMRTTLELEDKEEIHVSIPVLKPGIYPLQLPSDVAKLGRVGVYGIQGLDGENLATLAIVQSVKADVSNITFHDLDVSILGTYDPDEIIYTDLGRRLDVGGKVGVVAAVGLLPGCFVFLVAGRRSSSLVFLGLATTSAYVGRLGIRELGNRIRNGGHSTRRGG